MRLAWRNAAEDIPRMFTAAGRVAGGGQIALVVRPHDGIAVYGRTQRTEGALWQGRDRDAPELPTPVASARDVVVAARTAAKALPRRQGPITLRGQWSGALIVDPDPGVLPRIEITRKLSAYARLHVRSCAKGWGWEVERLARWYAEPAATRGGPHARLIDAIQAGLQAAIGLVSEACAQRDTQRRAAHDPAWAATRPVRPAREGREPLDVLREPQKAAPQKAAPKKAAPKNAAPKKAAPKKAAPKKAAPKNAAPKKAAPKNAAPKKAAPKNAPAGDPWAELVAAMEADPRRTAPHPHASVLDAVWQAGALGVEGTRVAVLLAAYDPNPDEDGELRDQAPGGPAAWVERLRETIEDTAREAWAVLGADYGGDPGPARAREHRASLRDLQATIDRYVAWLRDHPIELERARLAIAQAWATASRDDCGGEARAEAADLLLRALRRYDDAAGQVWTQTAPPNVAEILADATAAAARAAESCAAGQGLLLRTPAPTPATATAPASPPRAKSADVLGQAASSRESERTTTTLGELAAIYGARLSPVIGDGSRVVWRSRTGEEFVGTPAEIWADLRESSHWWGHDPEPYRITAPPQRRRIPRSTPLVIEPGAKTGADVGGRVLFLGDTLPRELREPVTPWEIREVQRFGSGAAQVGVVAGPVVTVFGSVGSVAGALTAARAGWRPANDRERAWMIVDALQRDPRVVRGYDVAPDGTLTVHVQIPNRVVHDRATSRATLTFSPIADGWVSWELVDAVVVVAQGRHDARGALDDLVEYVTKSRIPTVRYPDRRAQAAWLQLRVRTQRNALPLEIADAPPAKPRRAAASAARVLEELGIEVGRVYYRPAGVSLEGDYQPADWWVVEEPPTGDTLLTRSWRHGDATPRAIEIDAGTVGGQESVRRIRQPTELQRLEEAPVGKRLDQLVDAPESAARLLRRLLPRLAPGVEWRVRLGSSETVSIKPRRSDLPDAARALIADLTGGPTTVPWRRVVIPPSHLAAVREIQRTGTAARPWRTYGAAHGRLTELARERGWSVARNRYTYLTPPGDHSLRRLQLREQSVRLQGYREGKWDDGANLGVDVRALDEARLGALLDGVTSTEATAQERAEDARAERAASAAGTIGGETRNRADAKRRLIEIVSAATGTSPRVWSGRLDKRGPGMSLFMQWGGTVWPPDMRAALAQLGIEAKDYRTRGKVLAIVPDVFAVPTPPPPPEPPGLIAATADDVPPAARTAAARLLELAPSQESTP